MPSLIAQAAASSIEAALLEAYGTDGTLATLMAVAAVNFALAVTMFANLKRTGIVAERAIVRPH